MGAFQETLWIQEVIREVRSKPEKYSREKYFIKRQKKTEITQLGVIEKRILSMAACTQDSEDVSDATERKVESVLLSL